MYKCTRAISNMAQDTETFPRQLIAQLITEFKPFSCGFLRDSESPFGSLASATYL